MPEWLESMGYLGTYLGVVLEGEIVFLTAVQTARLGYLNFVGVLSCVFLGTLTADWLFFLAGRSKGRKVIKRFPKLQHRFEKMDERLERHDNWLLFVYRFMYGFRVVLPVLFGVRGVPPLTFGIYSFLATAVWVALFGTLGYYFAEWVILKLTHLQQYGWIVLILIIAAVFYFARLPLTNTEAAPEKKEGDL